MLKWNVYIEDINKRAIVPYNVFKYHRFVKDVKTILTQVTAEDVLSQLLWRSVSYNFAHRSEFETVITSWPPYIELDELDRLNEEADTAKRVVTPRLKYGNKISVADQLYLNWDAFVNYIWQNKEEFDVYQE